MNLPHRRLPAARRDVDVVGEWHRDGYTIRVKEQGDTWVEAGTPCDLVAWR
jgi:hypothetical protein